MGKLKLYLDCDGVILDTIDKSYEMIKSRNLHTEEEIKAFYCDIDWDDLIETSGERDNSISKIRVLLEYFDIEVLTHVFSDKELISKKRYFARELPLVNVIGVPKNVNKCDMVDPREAILVDDYLPNLVKWSEKGGVSVKFSDSGKTCDYIVITDLLELIKIDFSTIMR